LPPLFAAAAPDAFNHYLGLPPKLLFGIAVTINPLGLMLGSAVLGPLADRYGYRRVLLATAGGGALGHALSALALAAQQYPLFLLARLWTGVMEGNSSVARALLADGLEGRERFRGLALLNCAFFLGWLAGPLLGGATVAFGITVPFQVAAAALLLTGTLVAAVLPRDGAAPAATPWWRVARERHALNLLREPHLRTLFVVELAYACGVTAFYEFFPLWLVEVPHFDARGIAWTSAAMCALMTACSVLAGRLLRGDPLRQAAWAGFGVAAAVLGVALGDARWGLAAIVMYGIPNAIWNAVVPNWCAEQFGGAHGQGAVMGLISTTFCLASILTAAAGSGLALLDTRLVLGLGALLSGWAGWRVLGWRQAWRLAAAR
jgi:predicted MFS family arabinose efflux permease